MSFGAVQQAMIDQEGAEGLDTSKIASKKN
jgi:hypothetical protein